MYVSRYPEEGASVSAVPDNYAGVAFQEPAGPVPKRQESEGETVYIPKEFPKENVKVASVGANPWEKDAEPLAKPAEAKGGRFPFFSDGLSGLFGKINPSSLPALIGKIVPRAAASDLVREDVLIVLLAAVLFFSSCGDKITSLMLLSLLFVR